MSKFLNVQNHDFYCLPLNISCPETFLAWKHFLAPIHWPRRLPRFHMFKFITWDKWSHGHFSQNAKSILALWNFQLDLDYGCLLKHSLLISANVTTARSHFQLQGVFKAIKAEILQKTMVVIAFRNCVKELQLRESIRSERTIYDRKSCKTIMLLYLSGLIRRDHLLLLRKNDAY